MPNDPVERIPTPPRATRGRVASPRRTRREAIIHRMPDRYKDYLDGTLSLRDLDMEELERGQLRDINGRFSGAPPSSIPLSFFYELKNEYVRRVKQEHLVAVEEAYETLRGTLVSVRSPADAKVKAAKELLDRLEGTAQQNVNITGSVEVKAKWETLLESGDIVVDIEEPKQIENVQDAEVVEDDL